MSTIGTNSEDLVFNADGSGSDIKFKSNGTEVGSISNAGVMTATSYAGSGANLTGITTMAAGGTMTGDLLIHKQNPTITLKPNGANNAMKLMFKDENDVVKFTLGYQDSVSAFRLSSTDINADDYINVDTSGRVGIGTPSPACVAKGLHIQTSSAGTLPTLQADADDVVVEGSTPGITLMGATNGGGMLAFGDTDDADVGRIFYYHVNNNMDFITGGNTSLSIRSDGQLRSFVPASASKTNMSFYNGGVIKGSIVTSDYTNNTTYNTSSDYRLKENVNYTWDATTRLKQLKPARFNWIADDTNTLFDGFIAHEVQEIIPEAITGEKDAMTTNENGDAIIDPQGIDQSKFVPLLVKAMQEQQATIESLTARITALEG